MHPQYTLDPTYFLGRHALALSGLKHSITAVTVSVPDVHRAPTELRRYVEHFEENIGVPVNIVYCPNEGMSYGAFNRIWKKFGTAYDYYFFFEDDYVPVAHNFDDVLIGALEEYGTGYVCMHTAGYKKDEPPNHRYKYHAAIPMGVISSEALKKVDEAFGCLPHGRTDSNYAIAEEGQVEFGNAFHQLDLGPTALGKGYEVSLSMLGYIAYIGQPNPEKRIICPTQLVDGTQYELWPY